MVEVVFFLYFVLYSFSRKTAVFLIHSIFNFLIGSVAFNYLQIVLLLYIMLQSLIQIVLFVENLPQKKLLTIRIFAKFSR